MFRPLLDPDTSDSGKLDEAVALLTRGGRDVRHAMAMLIPEAWEHAHDLDLGVRGFYRYHPALMEPWDGPAGVVFTGRSGRWRGARPQRAPAPALGGLRGRLGDVCLEVGAVDLMGHGTVERGRLGPGQMIFVDPHRGVLHNDQIKDELAAQADYAHWAGEGFYPFDEGEPIQATPDELAARQAMHGYTKEELAMVLRPMAVDAKEPTFAMGDDSLLPHMAGRPRPIHHYLKQQFAQVTNPPIDPLRERRVMSLRTLLGRASPSWARIRTPPNFSSSSPSSCTRRAWTTSSRPTAIASNDPPGRHLPRGRRPGRLASRRRHAPR